MFEWDTGGKRYRIRQVSTEAEYHAIEELQREAWQFSDLDIVPAATMMATSHAGGCALGAFDGELMIGFAYGFPAFEDGRASLHSHMLAVKPDYRNAQAGFYLKLAQRDFALALHLDEITWTYDPLQSLNAHLNFGKLGVISERYVVNFYGEATSSPLHQGFGTDRLWVRWLINSHHVRSRIDRDPPSARTANVVADLEEAMKMALVVNDAGGPRLQEFAMRLAYDSCMIENPHDITALKARDPQAAVRWREATRAAFLAGIEAGFVVEDFLRATTSSGAPRWFYLLGR
jgi:predicted GNAT superfamily acetyltransferase